MDQPITLPAGCCPASLPMLDEPAALMLLLPLMLLPLLLLLLLLHFFLSCLEVWLVTSCRDLLTWFWSLGL
jgi:hypothetical protein